MVGLHPKTIERLIQRGCLPAYRLAGKIRIHCEDMLAWIESNQVAPSVHEI
jgi:excisionase family DNA binding protein